MKLSIAVSLITAALVNASDVRYDAGYDNGSRSMAAVACSDGANGLMARYGWQVQSQIAQFPYIGASDLIAGWNSPGCGVCLEVSYKGKTIHVLGIDHALAGLVTSEAAMNELTNGNAVQFGVVDAIITPVAASNCGVSPK